MAAKFSDSNYVNAHGCRPVGRGSWGFEFLKDGEKIAEPEMNPGWGDLATIWWVPGGAGLYSDGKKWAKAKARELGADEIRVCS